MANQKHLDILKQGVEVWNQWRKEYADVQPNLRIADLCEAELTGAHLYGADLSFANLREARLSDANLRLTDLSGAHLRGADLRGANLTRADLSHAILSEANLRLADLSESRLSYTHLSTADLRGANLTSADLSGADLSGADLSGAIVRLTVLGNVDLSVVKGLETVKHEGPSTIGIDAIYRSEGNISEAFLKGAGVDDTFITYIRSLVGKPIGYYSCFISYSTKDDAFARRLYADLQSHNVRCWFALEDMKIGDRMRDLIDQSIRLYDKLLLILSEHSVASEWVEDEVEAAMERESLAREQGEERTVLFPVRLDEAIMTTTKAWAAKLRRQRHIGDFTQWKHHDDYQKAFARLLRDLKAEVEMTKDVSLIPLQE